MKFSSQAVALAALSTVSAKNVTLKIESDDSALSGKGVSNIHFGAGINGALVSDSLVSYEENDQGVGQEITTGSGPIFYGLSEQFHVLVAAAGPGQAKVEDNYLTINGSNSVFYACSKLAWDPYSYVPDKTPYGVGVYASDAPSECKAIKIQVEDTGASGSSSSAPAGNATTSAAGGYGNTTVTAHETKYTTIPCSTPTTVTYNSKTYTVSEATTLTVEDCQCTENPQPSAVASPTGSSPAGSAPAIANGAASNKAGVAAVVAAAAYYLL